jgi:predicted Fe-Mo cluster-binding NifX family protein
MKIVVSSTGATAESPVDPRFGRAAQFILFDTETGEYRAVTNEQNLQAAQGAGIQAAMMISRLGAQYLITGNCGPKAFRALAAAGIKVIVGAEGTVAEVIEQFKAGKLQPSSAPNVDGHWA